MSDPIFLRRTDGTVTEMLPRPYDSEAVLQDLLADHPRLLIGSGFGASRLLLVSQEAGLGDSDGAAVRWSVDHLFIDENAVPVIVEVKRSTDTRIRREVVGQMLDYAANAVLYWPVERLRGLFEASCERRGESPDQLLSDHLGPEKESSTFWQSVATNLQAGRVRLMFVADVIPTELRRIIEFLNNQMTQADVLGVEVHQYAGEDGEVLVPSFIGQTAAANRAKSTGDRVTRLWDESSFLEELTSKRGPREAAIMKDIIDWCRPRFPRTVFGTGAVDGSFSPVYDLGGKSFYPIVGWTYGRLEVQFQYMRLVPPFDNLERRHEWQRRLNEIPGVMVPDDALEKRPRIPLSQLAQRSALESLLSTVQWSLDQFLTAQGGSVRELAQPS